MAYYVVDPSGGQYGPADFNLLQQWHREGRIMPSTTIRDDTTGLTMTASSIPGLIPSGPSAITPSLPSQPPPSPYGSSPSSPYSPVPSQGQYGPAPHYQPNAFGSNDITLAWICAGSGLVIGPCFCPFIGIGLGIGGWFFANRAKQNDSRSAQGPLLTSYAAIAFSTLMLVLGTMFRAMITG